MSLGLILPDSLPARHRRRLEFAFRVACGWYGQEAVFLTDENADFPFLRYGEDLPALYAPLTRPPDSVPVHGTDEAGRVDHLGELFSWISGEVEQSQSPDQWGRKLFATSFQKKLGLDPLRAPAVEAAIALFPQTAFPRVRMVAPTHDVDFLPVTLPQVLVRGSKNSLILLRARDPAGSLAVLGRTLSALLGQTPFRPLSEWAKAEARAGFRGSYYFLFERGHKKDGNYSPEQALKAARFLSSLGAEVGVHGSWHSLDGEQGLAEEYLRCPDPLGGRQHYLRHGPENRLLQSLENAGAEYDSTLAWPDHPGFRLGSSLPFPLYHLDEDRAGSVVQIPLAVMDVSLTGDNPELAKKLFSRDDSGAFAILWHDTVMSGMQHPRRAASLFWELQELSDHSWLPACEIAEQFRREFERAGIW